MSGITDTIEGLPGYDVAVDLWNEYAGEKFQTKDPYFETLEDGTTRRRKAPEGTTPSDAAVFKHIVSTAWKHDRCLYGCYWADWGIGQAPLISIIPVFGPWIMYTMHLRLNRMAEDLGIPNKLHMKMAANVTFDFLLTLVPILGAVFSYMNACSTRNAALVHSYLMKKAKENQARLGDYRPVQTPTYSFSRPPPTTTRAATATTTAPSPPPRPVPNPYPHVGSQQNTRQMRAPAVDRREYAPVAISTNAVPARASKKRTGDLEMGVR